MPKEIIYDDTYGPFVLTEAGETPVASLPPGEGYGPVLQRGVHVGWTRNQHVEIGVAMFETATDRNTGGPSGGHWTTLDRRGINRLIQSLRKARDQAFGRDE